VLSANVFAGRADTGVLAELIEREEPDFVALPEAGCDFLDKLLPLVAHLGYRGWAATPPGVPDIMGVVLLAGPRAGPLEVEPSSDLRYRHLRASGGILGDRELFAVHITAPRKPWLAVRWRRELGVVGRWTRRTPAPIVVGDLNATLDNGPLRAALGGCVPAARGRDALVGTYPSGLPRWFGIQIDHVLVPAGAATLRLDVRDVSGTDHRAVVARLVLPGLGLR
jgi:endonuclease/exonuclease/phosphatase (EEP) superfamily protein YafD